MFKWFDNILFPRLKREQFSGNSEIQLFLLLLTALAFALLMHLFLFIIFSISGTGIMITASAVSLALFAAMIVLLFKKRTYAAAGFSLAIDVIGFTMLMAHMVGTVNFCVLYLVILLIMQIIIPYTRLRWRALVLVCVWLSMMWLFFIRMLSAPVYDLGSLNYVLAVFNVCLGFLGITLELMINVLLQRVINYYRIHELETLESEANTDPLTGLHNRRYGYELFNRLAQPGTGDASYCAAMLDIDDFKMVNDVYGHAVGDLVLKELAATLRRDLRRTDLLFRWGGEEFLILLENVDLDSAYAIMEKLRISLSEIVVEANGDDISFTVTIGLAEVDRDNIEKSIEKSDHLLYIGKRGGKNRVEV